MISYNSIYHHPIFKWICLTVITTIIAKLVIFITKWIIIIKKCSRIPRPRTRPILGNMWDFMVKREELHGVTEQLFKTVKNEPVFCFWLSYIPIVVLNKARAAETLFTSFKNITKSNEYKMLSSWLGQGLLLSSGNKWHRHRKLLTPSFHIKVLTEFISVMNHQAELFVEKMMGHVGQDFFAINQDVKLLTLDILCETVMGKPINAQLNNDSHYVKAVQEVGKVFMYRGVRPWLHPQWIFNLTPTGRRQNALVRTMRAFAEKVIKEKRQNLISMTGYQQNGTNKKSNKPLPFLELLMKSTFDDGTSLTDEDILAEANTFIFAGHDTTAAAIIFTLHLLGLHPAIQQTAWEEINSVLGNADKPVTSTDLSKLIYLDAVIKESLRLMSPVPLIGRKIEEDINICGYQIPKGVNVFIPILFLHLDEEIYTEPKKFDPSRFSNGRDSDRNPFTYIPFSAGHRNCIGQKFALLELKVVLSKFLKNFQVISRDQLKDLQLNINPVLDSCVGTFIRLQRRT